MALDARRPAPRRIHDRLVDRVVVPLSSQDRDHLARQAARAGYASVAGYCRALLLADKV